MDVIEYRQLLPTERLITAAELTASLPLGHPGPASRPYTVVNFVTSADGRIAVDGHSRALSDAGDRELHRALRERVDAVLAGTGTVAAENYGRMLPGVERRERRLAAARRAEPLAVVVSRSGQLPLDVRLFAEPEARVVVFSPSAPPPELAAQVFHEPIPAAGEPVLTGVLAVLRERYEVGSLLCEGGPAMFSAMIAENIVDELFLTIAPTLVGGEGPAMVSGPAPALPPSLELASAMEREGSLFLRYLVSHAR